MFKITDSFIEKIDISKIKTSLFDMAFDSRVGLSKTE